MTLEQLRIFAAVAEWEHLTRAAEHLRLTPSAVSTTIRALEQRHGVVFFDRVGRRIELTELGRAFLDEARQVLARAARAEIRLAELAGRVGGTLRIEASLTVAAHWLPARLVAFRRAFPDVEVELAVANTAHVARAVTDGAADVGFVEGECDGAALVVRTVARDRLVLVAAPEFPSIVTGLPSDEDLAAFPWVLREPGSGTRSEFEAELRRRDVDPRALRVSLTLPTNEAVLAAAVAGGGVAALSAVAADYAVVAGRLRILDPCFHERPLQILRRGDRTPSGAVRAFLDHLDRDEVGGPDLRP